MTTQIVTFWHYLFCSPLLHFEVLLTNLTTHSSYILLNFISHISRVHSHQNLWVKLIKWKIVQPPQGLFNRPKFIFMASHITTDVHIKGLIWFIVTNEVKPRRTRNSAEYFGDYPIIYWHHHVLIDSLKWLRHRRFSVSYLFATQSRRKN